MKVVGIGLGIVALLLVMSGSQALASEISLLQGLYSSSKEEGGLKSSTINFGGRYGFQSDGSGFWFGQLFYSQTSYSGAGAPDSDSAMRIGGGHRYTFDPFTRRIEPYLSWVAEFAQEKFLGNDRSGIYYSGQAGLRFRFSQKFFVDLESSLFQSALTETVEEDNGGQKRKTSRMELKANTVGSFTNVAVSVGMRL